MAKLSEREKHIKTGKRFQRFQTFASSFQNSLRGSKTLGDKVFIDTEYGRVKTLWYGFEKVETSPVFFDLHGGGFILGVADHDEKMNLKISETVGCKIISIEYAKAPDHPFPAALNQVYAVVEHCCKNADKYAIDKHKMAIGGHSAGGNLSTAVCMKSKQAGDFQFSCQILDYPPLDLATNPSDKPTPRRCIPPKIAMIFNSCYVDPTQAKDPFASPVFASQEQLEGLPPALVILAGRDSLHDEGAAYCQMLQNAGIEVECHDYPNALHGFTLNDSEDSKDAVEKMAAFLIKHLN